MIRVRITKRKAANVVSAYQKSFPDDHCKKSGVSTFEIPNNVQYHTKRYLMSSDMNNMKKLFWQITMLYPGCLPDEPHKIV
jgi:hypothetical protein